MAPVKPNLGRIPGDDEARAKAILTRTQETIAQQFLDALDEGDFIALARFGARQPTIALREHSVACLRDALLASAISQLGRESDPVT